MPLQEDYRVALDAFHGPLDLLLYLIRRAEVDVSDIPVAAITDQYLAFLQQVENVDVEEAGEFLVMAATLIELKSRTLMPPEPIEGEGGPPVPGAPGFPGTEAGGGLEPSDPRYDLVQQLLAYQRVRVASEELDLRRLEFENRFARRPGRRPGDGPAEDEPEPVTLDLDDVHLMDVAGAYERIISSIDFTCFGDHVVEIDDTPIALHQEDLLDRLQRAPGSRLTLQEVFVNRTPGHRVGLFLATLELARQCRLTVEQDSIDAVIEVVLTDEVAAADPATGRQPEGTA